MKNKFINKEIYYSIILLCTPPLVLFGIYFYSNSSKATLPAEAIQQPATVIESTNTYIPNPFDKVDIKAKAVLVKDLNTGEIIHSKNKDQRLALASVSKIMTALTAYKHSENLDKFVYITPSSLMIEGNTFLTLGEKFVLRELIDFMLISSSNHAAVAVAENIENYYSIDFIYEMNVLAEEIGMSDSHFLNVTGLDEGVNKAGSFGTALDVGKMFEYALKNYPEIFEITRETEFSKLSASGILHSVNNTNDIVSDLNNLIASKTGFTDLAGGNLGVIVDPGLNNPILIVVLGSTREGRFDDVLTLTQTLEQYFDYQLTN